MLMNTHHKIAHTVYHSLPDHLKEEISFKSFRSGNRNPDFMIKYKKFKHTVCASFDIIQKEIDELLHMDVTKKQFSKKLGYICHFISDYACGFHNNPEVKAQGFVKQMKFERAIEQTAKEKTLVIKEWNIESEYENIMSHIYQEVFHENQGEEFCSPKQDLYRALDMTYRFVHLFLDKRLQVA